MYLHLISKMDCALGYRRDEPCRALNYAWSRSVPLPAFLSVKETLLRMPPANNNVFHRRGCYPPSPHILASRAGQTSILCFSSIPRCLPPATDRISAFSSRRSSPRRRRSCKISIRAIESTRPCLSRFGNSGKGLARFLSHLSPKDSAGFPCSIWERGADG